LHPVVDRHWDFLALVDVLPAFAFGLTGDVGQARQGALRLVVAGDGDSSLNTVTQKSGRTIDGRQVVRSQHFASGLAGDGQPLRTVLALVLEPVPVHLGGTRVIV